MVENYWVIDVNHVIQTIASNSRNLGDVMLQIPPHLNRHWHHSWTQIEDDLLAAESLESGIASKGQKVMSR